VSMPGWPTTRHTTHHLQQQLAPWQPQRAGTEASGRPSCRHHQLEATNNNHDRKKNDEEPQSDRQHTTSATTPQTAPNSAHTSDDDCVKEAPPRSPHKRSCMPHESMDAVRRRPTATTATHGCPTAVLEPGGVRAGCSSHQRVWVPQGTGTTPRSPLKGNKLSQ